MKVKISKVFLITSCFALAGLGAIFIYFAVNCYDIAKFHIEPQLDAAILQFIAGIISAIVFMCIKYFRRKMYWYFISLTFIVFAVLDYFTIVGCQICGALT